MNQGTRRVNSQQQEDQSRIPNATNHYTTNVVELSRIGSVTSFGSPVLKRRQLPSTVTSLSNFKVNNQLESIQPVVIHPVTCQPRNDGNAVPRIKTLPHYPNASLRSNSISNANRSPQVADPVRGRGKIIRVESLNSGATETSPSFPTSTSTASVVIKPCLIGTTEDLSNNFTKPFSSPSNLFRQTYPVVSSGGSFDSPTHIQGSWLQPTDSSPPSANNLHSSLSSTDGRLLVQQRSTESHDSSVSAISSGSGSIVHRLFRQRTLDSYRPASDQGRVTPILERANDTITEATRATSSHNSGFTYRRRSSYELATTIKSDESQRASKRISWKAALKLLKEKRDALFKNEYEHIEDPHAPSDPVYHLLRCAAHLGHQPGGCKCICHFQPEELARYDLSAPIGALMSPQAKPATRRFRPPSKGRHRSLISRSSSSSATTTDSPSPSAFSFDHFWHRAKSAHKSLKSQNSLA